jgi:hypothetical protein
MHIATISSGARSSECQQRRVAGRWVTRLCGRSPAHHLSLDSRPPACFAGNRIPGRGAHRDRVIPSLPAVYPAAAQYLFFREVGQELTRRPRSRRIGGVSHRRTSCRCVLTSCVHAPYAAAPPSPTHRPSDAVVPSARRAPAPPRPTWTSVLSPSPRARLRNGDAAPWCRK